MGGTTGRVSVTSQIQNFQAEFKFRKVGPFMRTARRVVGGVKGVKAGTVKHALVDSHLLWHFHFNISIE